MSQLARNTLISAVETITLIAAAIVTTPLILHGLGDARYGLFVFISMFSITGVLSFLDFGMEGALMTAVAKADAVNDQAKVNGLRRAGTVYYSMIGILVGIVIALFLGVVAKWMQIDVSNSGISNLSGIAMAAGMNVALQFMAVPYIAHIQGMQRFVGIKTTTVVLNILQYSIITFIAIKSHRLDLIVIAIATVSALRVAISGYLSFRMTKKSDTIEPLGVCLRELSHSSSWLLGNRIVGLVYNNTHKGLISAGLPISSLGVFDIIARPASFFRVLLGIIYSAAIPRSASLNSRSEREGLTNLFVCLTTISALVLLPVGCWLIGQSRNILSVWIGPEYAVHSFALQLLIVAGLLNMITSIVSTMAVGMEIIPKTLKIALSVTIANLIASIICIPMFGVTGAAIALCVAEGIGLPMTLVLLSKELPGGIVALKGNAIRLIMVSAVAFPVQLLVGNHPAIGGTTGVLTGIGIGLVQGLIGLVVLTDSVKRPVFEAALKLIPAVVKPRRVVS